MTLIEPGFVRSALNAAMSNLPGPGDRGRCDRTGDCPSPAGRDRAARYRIAVFLTSGSSPGVHRRRIRRRAHPGAPQPRRAQRENAAANRRMSCAARARGRRDGASAGIRAGCRAAFGRVRLASGDGLRNDGGCGVLTAAAVRRRKRRSRAAVATRRDRRRADRGPRPRRSPRGSCALAAVVSNAGIAIGGPLEYLPSAELRRQFDVNVFGAVAVAQAFLPQLRARRAAGSIIHPVDLGAPCRAVHCAVQRVEVRPARARRRAARRAGARRNRGGADRAELGEDADLAEGARLAGAAPGAAAAQGAGVLRRADRRDVRHHRPRGAHRDAGRARRRCDRPRAYGSQTPRALPARRGRSRRQRRRAAAHRVARPRAARLAQATWLRRRFLDVERPPDFLEGRPRAWATAGRGRRARRRRFVRSRGSETTCGWPG